MYTSSNQSTQNLAKTQTFHSLKSTKVSQNKQLGFAKQKNADKIKITH